MRNGYKTARRSIIDSICNREEIALKKMNFFIGLSLFPSLFHMIITSMHQGDIFAHRNASSCAGAEEIYGDDQKAVCDMNPRIYSCAIVPRTVPQFTAWSTEER